MKFLLTEENSNAEFIRNIVFQLIIGVDALFACIGIEVAVKLIIPKLAEYHLNKLTDKIKWKQMTGMELLLTFRNITIQTIDHVR